MSYSAIYSKLCEVVLHEFNVHDEDVVKSKTYETDDKHETFGLKALVQTLQSKYGIIASSFLVHEIRIEKGKYYTLFNGVFSVPGGASIVIPIIIVGKPRAQRIDVHVNCVSTGSTVDLRTISFSCEDQPRDTIVCKRDNQWCWYTSNGRHYLLVTCAPWDPDTHLEYSRDVQQAVTTCLALSARSGGNMHCMPVELLVETFCLLAL